VTDTAPAAAAPSAEAEPASTSTLHPNPAAALVLVGTPIGNIDDASPRMRRAIEKADVIAAEDTRRFHGLCDRLGIRTSASVLSLFDHNEAARAPELADHVAAGRTVVLLTDAGMPAVSDPGYRVVKEVAERGLPVTSAPGASAAVTALAVSGLPSDRWAFEGFLPRKAGERRRLAASLAHEQRTLVFYESPHRVADAVRDLADGMGADRPAVICRELTKTYEETLRGTLGELADAATEGLRGEICIVVAPGEPEPAPAPEAVTGEVAALVDAGARAKQAAAQVASAHGLRTREVYEAYLKQK
jgi:16S rRNA (cytidine1402-2'-O)-methyltransferase